MWRNVGFLKPFEGSGPLFRRLFEYMRPHLPLFVTGVVTIPFSILAAVSQPWILAHVIDRVFVAGKPEMLAGFVVLFVVVVAGGYAADAVYNYSLQKLGQLTIHDMRKSAFERCLRFPRSYFDKTPTGVLLTRLTSDFEAMGESMASGVLTIFIDMLKTVFLFAMLFYLNYQLTLLLIAILVPSTWLTTFFRKKLRVFYQTARSALAVATGYLYECLAGMKTIRLYGAERKVLDSYLAKHRRFLDSQKSVNVFETLLFSLVEGITAFAVSVILWGGVNLTLHDLLTVGVLIAFIGTLQKIFVPIREFAQQNAAILRSLAGLRSIDQLFREEVEREPAGPNQAVRPFESLEFRNVSFRYGPDKPLVLRDLSFTLKAGERLALVGETGSGKSTVIRLLGKQYSEYEGEIFFNGRELGEFAKAEIRQSLAVMHQDAFMFDESVSFNIRLDRKGIGAEEVRQASIYVNADSFIRDLPDGYEFPLKSNGSNISSGQGQLINFARVIAERVSLIVLDEATSAVDSITENKIETTIKKIFEDKTVIAIAHRLSTIRNSDTILVISAGRIVERGNHETLMRLDGKYAKLVNEAVSQGKETLGNESAETAPA